MVEDHPVEECCYRSQFTTSKTTCDFFLLFLHNNATVCQSAHLYKIFNSNNNNNHRRKILNKKNPKNKWTENIQLVMIVVTGHICLQIVKFLLVIFVLHEFQYRWNVSHGKVLMMGSNSDVIWYSNFCFYRNTRKTNEWENLS